MEEFFTIVLVFFPIIAIFSSVLYISTKNNIPKEEVNGYPTITFKEFLEHYNDAPQKWDYNFDCDHTIYLKYETERIYFTTPKDEKKFEKWCIALAKAKTEDNVKKKLSELQKKWAFDANEAEKRKNKELFSLQKQYDETAAAAQYWENAYNEVMKGQK